LVFLSSFRLLFFIFIATTFSMPDSFHFHSHFDAAISLLFSSPLPALIIFFRRAPAFIISLRAAR